MLSYTMGWSHTVSYCSPQVQSELFDVTYLRCGMIQVDKAVELAIEQFANSLRSNSNFCLLPKRSKHSIAYINTV